LVAKVGQEVTLTVEAQGYRPNKQGSEKARDRYWKVIPPNGHQAATAAAPATPTPAPAAERPAARIYPTIQRPSLNPNADKYSAAAEVYSQWHMNRRTALMQATKAVLTHPGTITVDGEEAPDDLALDDVIFAAADRRFAWLQSTTAPTEAPRSPTDAPDAPEPAPDTDTGTSVADLPFDPTQEP